MHKEKHNASIYLVLLYRIFTKSALKSLGRLKIQYSFGISFAEFQLCVAAKMRIFFVVGV